MSEERCKCGSYAINPRLHGRKEGVDLHLCDVCYWRTRSNPIAQKRIAELEADIHRWKEDRHKATKRIAELEEDNAQVCEWICKDSDILLYGGTCGTEWIFDEPPVGDYNYCPKCGRHIHISEVGGDE